MEMKTIDLIAALTARASSVRDWDFSIWSNLDEDGDGKVVLTVTIPNDEASDITDEPWKAFGDFPVGQGNAGILSDDNNTYQFVEFYSADGVARG